MNEVIYCQILYAVVALLFNATSFVRARIGLPAFTVTNPVRGLIMMLLVLIITLSYPFMHGWIYIVGWIALIIKIVPTGVVRHLKNIFVCKNTEKYSSSLIAYFAVAQNIFGMTVGAVGVFIAVSLKFSS